MPQSRAAMAVARALAPASGERVLDLCAAPGRQDHPPGGADGQRGGDRRRREAPGARRRAAQDRGPDGRDDRRRAHPGRHASRLEPVFDRVLVDPPCSDLGTLASRPDARWRKAGRPEALAALQRADPGGRSGRVEARRYPGVLDLHDLAHRERAASWQPFWPLTRISQRPTWAPTCLSGSIRPCRSTFRRSRTATAPTDSSSRGSGAHDRGDPWRRLPVLPRAVAAPHEPPRPLSLRELPAPLRAALGVPELRRALDDRAHVEHRPVYVRPLSVLDADADLATLLQTDIAPLDSRRRLRPALRAGPDSCSTPARR